MPTETLSTWLNYLLVLFLLLGGISSIYILFVILEGCGVSISNKIKIWVKNILK